MKNFEYITRFRLTASHVAEADAQIKTIETALERLNARVISTAPANTKTEVSHAIAMSADAAPDDGHMTDARKRELGIYVADAETPMTAQQYRDYNLPVPAGLE